MVVTNKSSGDSLTPNEVNDITGNLGAVKSGCTIYEQAVPSLTVEVEIGVVYIQEKRVSISATTKTLSAADGSNERIDLIVVGSDGTVDTVEGTPSVSPVTPDIPAGHIGLAKISVPASDTTITNDQITDIRDLLGEEKIKFIHAGTFTTTSGSEVELDTVTVRAGNNLTDLYVIDYFIDTTGGNPTLAFKTRAVGPNTQTLTNISGSDNLTSAGVGSCRFWGGTDSEIVGGWNTDRAGTITGPVAIITPNDYSGSVTISCRGNISSGTLSGAWKVWRIKQ